MVAVTVQMPTVVVETTPVVGFTLQTSGVLVAKLNAPVPVPPPPLTVTVLPNTRLGAVLETVTVAWVAWLMVILAVTCAAAL